MTLKDLTEATKPDELFGEIDKVTRSVSGLPPRKEIVENAFGLDEEVVDDKYQNLLPSDDIFDQQIEEEVDEEVEAEIEKK